MSKQPAKYTKEDLERYTISELKREEEGATGFSVDIVYDCPHQDSDLADLPVSAVANAFSTTCKHCDEDEENWLCMKCGDVCCSRYKNAHMQKHNQDTKHNITMSLVDLSFWCYGCYSYIESRRTRSIRGFASAIKFGNISVSEGASAGSGSSSATTTASSSSSSESKGKQSAGYTEDDLEKYSLEDLEREQKGETGFNINVAYDCPHIQDHFSQMKVQTLADALAATCSNCTEKEENWLCLKCGKTFCSRYKNAHMKQHNEQSGHLLAFSLTDFSCWCYSCSSYVESGRIKQLRNVASGLKFNNIEISDPKPQRPKGSTSHATEAEIQEHFDDEKKLAEDAKKVAQLLKSCKHCVVYTGAGISTSASIPDYRGPQGVWTLRDKGMSAPGIDIEQAFPAYGHYAIQELVKSGIVKYVVSTNVDGLHRRSGVPEDKIAELHGNCYREVCEKCKKEYLRGFDVTKTVKVYTNHITGRKCACGGALKDTIIHFSENLPEKELELAVKHSEAADVTLVLGTSMRVAPACKLPLLTLQKNGNMIIVNLQITPYDKKSTIRSFSKTDEFLRLVMKELGKETFDTSFDALQVLKK